MGPDLMEDTVVECKNEEKILQIGKSVEDYDK